MRALRFLIVVPVLFALVSPAAAIKPFYDEFKKDYLDTHKDKKFAESVDKAEGGGKCLICHQGTKQKKNRNAFGNEIGKLLDRKKDSKNTEKMDAAFKKVLAMHVNPKNPKSETYMDRLKAGKWPAGELADLKKEPKDSKESKEGAERKE